MNEPLRPVVEPEPEDGELLSLFGQLREDASNVEARVSEAIRQDDTPETAFSFARMIWSFLRHVARLGSDVAHELAATDGGDDAE